MIVLMFEVLVGIEGFVTVRCEMDPQYHLASISAILDRGLMNFLRNSNIALLMQSKDIRDHSYGTYLTSVKQLDNISVIWYCKNVPLSIGSKVQDKRVDSIKVLIQFVADGQAYPAIIDNQSQLQNILQEALTDLLRLIKVQSIFDKFEIKKGTIKKLHKSLWKTNSLCKDSLNCSLKNITWPIEVSKKKGIIITTAKKPY